MSKTPQQALQAFSKGEMTALELRRLGGGAYGDLLCLLDEANLPVPSAPVEGREQKLKIAREWMFPKPVS